MDTTRPIDTDTLDQAAKDWAGQFLQDSQFSRTSPAVAIAGRDWVMQSFYRADFKDEFDYLLPRFKDWLGASALTQFEALSKEVFAPRSDQVYRRRLAEKLAINPDGSHIPGKIGTTIVGARPLGTHLVEFETPDSIRERKRALAAGITVPKSVRRTRIKEVALIWPVYAGEDEERAANSGVAADFPPGVLSRPTMALNTRISNECALLACDAIVDNLDEGSSNAVIQIRSGTQPADPDTTATGTLLASLACSDPAFGAAADAGPGGQATANSITDDSSADATGTAGYFRASATNDGSTPLDDHIDGEVGTSGADLNLNTVSIVSGAVVSISSWTVTMPES